jgi:hypothetical protein
MRRPDPALASWPAGIIGDPFLLVAMPAEKRQKAADDP